MVCGTCNATHHHVDVVHTDLWGLGASFCHISVTYESTDHSTHRKHVDIVEDSLHLGGPCSHLYFRATLERTSVLLETLCRCGLKH